MENWDYANLSKAAKAAGGPEELAKELFEAGVAEGKKQEHQFTWVLAY